MRALLKVLMASGTALMLSAAAPSSDSVHPFDLEHSTMTVYVYKQGIFAFAADNHEISAPIAAGSYDSGAQSVELRVEAKTLRVLDPSMAPDRRATVQANTVGPLVLDADRFPTIEFRSTKIDATKAGGMTVVGDLTLHGQTHPIVVSVERTAGGHFTGSAMIRQTMFGITPIRIVGGTVKVKDDVKVTFDVALAH